MDRPIDELSASIMMAKDRSDDTCKPNMPESIFNPINNRITASPFCRWWKRCRKFSIRKNSALRPMMAKILEVNTTNKFCEIANTAGMESTAKIMSVPSMSSMMRKSEVNMNLPVSKQKNFPL